MTPPPARRRDRRYHVALPVTIVLGRRKVESETIDVSHGGMFVVSEEAPGLGQLVKVQIALPPLSQPFEAAAKLVHVAPAVPRAERRGFGVQLYGVGRDVRAEWDAFIDHVRSAYPDSEERSTTVVAAERIELAHRRRPGQVAGLRVDVRSVQDLVTMAARDLARARIFLLAPHVGRIGDEVSVLVTHPVSGAVFELAGSVRRVVDDAGLRGLELDLVACDDERRARFEEFIYDEIADIFDDEEVRDR